MVEEEKEE